MSGLLGRWPRVSSAFVLFVACSGGCAGHSARTKTARAYLDQGAPWKAIDAINKELDVERADQQPAELEAEDSLLLLERASILQQVARYSFSSRDLETADKHIELLDFSREGLDDLGRYLYSDDSGPYRAPAYEKLMINTLNMVNYLSAGDLQGARVEARRFATMRAHLKDESGHGVMGDALGNYLAALTFELSDNTDEARVFYNDILDGTPAREISDMAKEALTRLGKKPPVCEHPEGCGTLVVVSSVGRLAPKESRRIPIGLALTYASVMLSARYTHLAGQGLVTWVNYPELGRTHAASQPNIWLDQNTVGPTPVLNLDAIARSAWREARAAVVASAIIRAISRALAGEATRQAVGGTLGAVLSLGGQAALSAADTPDTRSWSTLPSAIFVARRQVRAGKQTLDFAAQGIRERRSVNVRKGGWALVSFVALR
ncbi:MAG: hypothetical protein H6715_02340 [Myxococcales bacterium]|nr:hypothetical protein [Myxococcales bacterium]MCB9708756.1 hypothetical protein [Myxococcales bacterium]